jgi:hypothetical protein
MASVPPDRQDPNNPSRGILGSKFDELAEEEAKRGPTEIGHLLPSDPFFFSRLREPLGALVLEFSNVESEVTGLIDALLGIEHTAGVALEWMMQNFSLRIELFYFLASQKSCDIETKTMADELYTALKQANADRNDLIHGQWNGYSPIDDTYSKVRLKVQNGKMTSIPVHGISLYVLAEEVQYIFKIGFVLATFRSRLLHPESLNRFPSPFKLPPRSPLHELFNSNKKKLGKIE